MDIPSAFTAEIFLDVLSLCTALDYVKCFLKGHFMDKIDIIVKRFSLKRAEFTEARPTSFFDRTNRRLIENTNE